jgi:hypothetical protein
MSESLLTHRGSGAPNIPMSLGWKRSSDPANRSFPMYSTCSSSPPSAAFRDELEAPFVGGGDEAAPGPERMYPVREVEFGEKSGRTYSCTIGFLRGFRLTMSACVAKAAMPHTADSLAKVQFRLIVHTDIPAGLANSFNDSSLINHIPLAERDEML